LARAATHRTAAANLAEIGESLGFPPSPAELAYSINLPPDPNAARATARDVELDCADAYSVLVARLSARQPTARNLFVDAMIARILAARDYGTVPSLPGLAEHR
jgi:hypothetical protein